MKLLYGIAGLIILVNFVSSEVDTKLGHQARDESVDQYITLVLINFSEVMRVGSPILGIPILDPFHINYVQVEDFNNHHLKLNANASNILVSKISYYVPTYVHVEFGDLTIYITLNLDEIDFNGTYWCEGMYQFIFPVFGDGPFDMEVYNNTNAGDGSVYITDDGYLQISYLNMTIVFEDLVINLENFLGGGDFGDQINAALSQFGLLFFQALMPKIQQEVLPALVNYLNAALMQHTLLEIIAGALPGPP